MALFKEYKNHPDKFIRERANKWAIAIGLQRVDSLNVSDFLIQVARQEIITIAKINNPSRKIG